MQKAKFSILTAKGKYTGRKDFMDVLFNPETYSVESGAEYSGSTVAGFFEDALQFTKQSPRKLSFDLVFDTMNTKGSALGNFMVSTRLQDIFADNHEDVRKYITKLHKLVEKEKDGNTVYPPPVVEFAWGSFSFVGVVESFRENYTLFQRDGTPIKATVSITMKEYSFQAVAKLKAPSASANLLNSQNVVDESAKATAMVKAVL